MANVDYYDMQLVKAAIADPKQNKSLYNRAKYRLSKNSDELNAFRGVDSEQKKFEKLTPMEQYKRLSGEVEARNVQTRIDMTPEQRRLTPPWKTEDVPRSDQIVKYGGAGASLSALAALTPEQAQANTARIDLPSNVEITAPFIDQSNIPTQFRPGLGGIQSPISPSFINQAGGKLKRLEFPVIGNPLEGVSDYLENFGYEDSSAERLKRAAMAGLDII